MKMGTKDFIIKECQDKIDSCQRRIDSIDKWLNDPIKKQWCAENKAILEKDLLVEMRIFAKMILSKQVTK